MLYADPIVAADALDGDPAVADDVADRLDGDDIPEAYHPRVIIGQDPAEPDPPPAPFPVAAAPGSVRKKVALAARAAAGVDLWHIADAPLCRETAALGSVGRQGGLRHGYGRRMNPRDVDSSDGGDVAE